MNTVLNILVIGAGATLLYFLGMHAATIIWGDEFDSNLNKKSKR